MEQHPALAIVGYSYRAPSVGRTRLWDFLCEGKSAWARVPSDRFNQGAHYFPNYERAGTFSSKGAHFLPDNIYAFDAPFFNLRLEEARAMDPQQRMLLECAYEAAESAGLSIQALAGSNTGVFAANESLDYGDQTTQDPPSMNKYTGIGMAPCMFANRLSYFFDLKGPSISVDAACASSSYALHLASKSLQSGECRAAIVGGAHLILSPTPWIILDNAGMLSPDGRSYSYDTRAKGFGRGEGAACLVVKRLSDAVEDGDCIRAIIRNTAASHSGRTNGITMPSQPAQEELLMRLHREVGLDPRDTDYIEGHGTGTQVGDPVDAGSIAAVFGKDRMDSSPVFIGALKSNFGHTEGASGVLGVIKTVMMLERSMILPNANFNEMSHKIVGREKLMVVKRPTPWPKSALRRACATNFGFGGANAAVLLEAASTSDAAASHSAIGRLMKTKIDLVGENRFVNLDTSTASLKSMRSQLFVFSAKSEASLHAYLTSFKTFLQESQHDSKFFHDLSFTLGERRSHFNFRHAIAASCLSDLKENLTPSSSSSLKSLKIREPVIGLAFTGQGAQYARMANDLSQFPQFGKSLFRADKILRNLGASWSLAEELGKPEEDSRVGEASISQPACTAVQLALVILIRDVWKVKPAVVVGHSSGEIAAAFAAGHLSFETALAVAFFRGEAAARLQQNQDKKGAMLALGIGESETQELLHTTKNVGYLALAAVNSPESTTVSGDACTIEALYEAAEAKNIFVRRLKIDVAYHSQHMSPAGPSYSAAIKPYLAKSAGDHAWADVTFVSSVTEQVETSLTTRDPSYWVKNLLNPVRFSGALRKMCVPKMNSHQIPDVLIEIGPHSALKTPIKQTLDAVSKGSDNPGADQTICYLPSLVRGTEPMGSLMLLAGNLFTAGYNVDMQGVNQTPSGDVELLNNLPAYEWQKNATYIHRARVPAERLSNTIPFNPLLGGKNPYPEGDEVSFRNVFTLDDLPWIRGHNIGGDILFPLTGFMSLAIEAFRIVKAEINPKTIGLKEFHMKRSLKIEEEERIDVTTKLRPSSTGTAQFSSKLWSFEILTWSEASGWITHCYGQVEASPEDLDMESHSFRSAVEMASRKDLTELDPAHEYMMADKVGTVYGPEYRTMCTLRQAPGVVVHQILQRTLDPMVACTAYGSAVTVDPPTLDAFFHALSVIQETDQRGLYVPTYFNGARMSNQILNKPQQLFTISTRRLQLEPKSGTLRMSFSVYTELEGSPTAIFELENLTLKCIKHPSAEVSEAQLPDGFTEDFVPYVKLLTEDDFIHMSAQSCVPEPDLLFQRQVESVSMHLMAKALKATIHDDTAEWPPFMMKARDWAARLKPKILPDLQASRLMSEISAHSAPGKLTCEVGKRFTEILRGEIKPLEIMLQDGLLNRHYEEDLHTKRGSASLARLIRLLSSINPNMTILEIGAGTGGTTSKILDALTSTDEDEESQRTWHYTYTDISSGFFENARTKLAKWSSRITYQKLDVSQDAFAQGFVGESFDLIVAANVLHATPNMEVTMTNVASLLKPGGTLALLEVITHSPVAMPFALLPGWWLSEDKYRGPDGPLMTKTTWNQLLLDTGFEGVRGYISEYPERERLMAAMWSRKAKSPSRTNTTGPRPPSVTISGMLLTTAESGFADQVAQEIALMFPCEVIIQPIHEVVPVSANSWYIFLDSAKMSLCKTMTRATFDALKEMILNSAGFLWVRPEAGVPETAAARAMLTTIRHEDASRKLYHLDQCPWTPSGISCISKVAKELCDPAASQWEQEFTCKDGLVHVPRFRPVKSAKQAFAMDAGASVIEQQNIWQGSDVVPLELTVKHPGSLDSLYFRRSDTLANDLDEDEVIIRVTAAGVNFRDLLLVLGSLPWMPPGFEGVGTVVRRGSKIKHIKDGDDVLYLTKDGGGFATHTRAHGAHVCRLPANVDKAVFAGIGVAYLTAYLAVIEIGRLNESESILIHAATGAVGQACLALAKLRGAGKIYATAGTSEKRKLLHEQFGLPVSHIFDSRTPAFAEKIREATGGNGVRVVVNSLSGDLLQHSWSLVADFGRFVEIGKADILQNSNLPMRQFDRHVTFSSIDVLKYLDKYPAESQKLLTEIINLIHTGAISPVTPTTIVPVSDISSAFRKLQSGQNIGKLVAILDSNAVVAAECIPHLGLPSSSHQVLNVHETYIITGGTGGIGRDLAVWMFENGARNVVLLGRSGSSNTAVKELLGQYHNTKYQLRAIACDVASKTDLQSALRSISDLPKVCGVIHGALYLHDAMFTNATFDDWVKITGPKIRAAWHLHELLPDLHFFVTLGSVEGVTGNLGQSIYAGTSTFMDAFVDHRIRQGLAATSVHLPVVQDVGYVAKLGIFDSMKQALGLSITREQLHTIVKAAIIGPSSGLCARGRITCFVRSIVPSSEPQEPWERFNALWAMRRRREIETSDRRADGDGSVGAVEPTNVLDALAAKIAAITLMDTDEVTPKRPLGDYGLDSLVSVELRNWIRRELNVDLAITQIVRTRDLQELADLIAAY